MGVCVCVCTLPVYTGIVEEIESIALHVYSTIFSYGIDNSPLRYAGLQQSIVHGNRDAILIAENHLWRYLRFKRQMTHFMISNLFVV